MAVISCPSSPERTLLPTNDRGSYLNAQTRLVWFTMVISHPPFLWTLWQVFFASCVLTPSASIAFLVLFLACLLVYGLRPTRVHREFFFFFCGAKRRTD